MPRIKIYVRLRDVSNIESATWHLREISVDENHVILSYKLVKMDMVKLNSMHSCLKCGFLDKEKYNYEYAIQCIYTCIAYLIGAEIEV